MVNDFDKSNLRSVILDAPKQFAYGFELSKGIKVGGKFASVIFYGEGGSAFPVSIVNSLVSDASAQAKGRMSVIYQNHTYSLTLEAANSLNIFCSYSGNTEETITTLNRAVEEGLSAIVIASGGKLEEIAKSKNLPFVKLPMPNVDFQPRMGTGYFVAIILQILANHDLASDLKEQILGDVDDFESSMGKYEHIGKELAGKIFGKTPVIWSSQKYKELARVWSIKFNEHAKNPAFWNFFPELNHNLMVGFTNLGERYFAIMLKDPDDDVQNLRRYPITADILKGYKMNSEILDMEGKNMFSKMFASIYIADFTAYYLAEKNGIDPTPVEMVEELKKRLK